MPKEHEVKAQVKPARDDPWEFECSFPEDTIAIIIVDPRLEHRRCVSVRPYLLADGDAEEDVVAAAARDAWREFKDLRETPPA